MKIFYHTCLFCLTLISFNIHSQIAIGENTEPKKDTLIKLKNDIKPKREIDGSTEVFGGSIWSKSNRKLVENGDVFGDSLGKRADEQSLTTWSYVLGFRNYLTRNFAIEGGIGLMKNGESYHFEGADSTFDYQTTYTYIAMPLKFNYCYGNEIRFMSGIGVIPAMFTKYRQAQQWENNVNEKGDIKINNKSGYNSFIISGCLNAGIQLKYSPSWSIYVIPEYRFQLNSSYTKIDSYKHYSRAYGINFGFVYQL